MYAIVEIAGQQFKVAKDQRIFVHRLEAKEGASVNFDQVLLIDNGGKVSVGAPAVEGAQVKAKVLSHLKGDKVIVFKKKRRKGYQKSNGHRQYLTEIEIQQILESGAKKSAPAAKETEKKEEGTEVKAEKAPKAAAKPKAEDKPKAEAKPKGDDEAKTDDQ
jgi:large subunit ribosomal protein L21